MIKHAERFFLPTANAARATLTYTPSGKLQDFVTLKVNGESAIVPISSFYKFILLLVGEEEQEKIIPTETVTRRTFRKVVGIRVPPDYKRGDIIEVPVEFAVDIPESARLVGDYVKEN